MHHLSCRDLHLIRTIQTSLQRFVFFFHKILNHEIWTWIEQMVLPMKTSKEKNGESVHLKKTTRNCCGLQMIKNIYLNSFLVRRQTFRSLRIDMLVLIAIFKCIPMVKYMTEMESISIPESCISLKQQVFRNLL